MLRHNLHHKYAASLRHKCADCTEASLRRFDQRSSSASVNSTRCVPLATRKLMGEIDRPSCSWLGLVVKRNPSTQHAELENVSLEAFEARASS